MTIDVYIEKGLRRVVAGAVDWPGWCRIARHDDDALQMLVAYGPRYVKAVGAATIRLPKTVSGLRVVERLAGDTTTDFGVPSRPPSKDAKKVSVADLAKLLKIQRAAWAAFDATARAADGIPLSKGPRGGGRDVGKMIEHVFGADRAYLSRAGGSVRKERGEDDLALGMRVREAIVDELTARVKGSEPSRKSSSGTLWSPGYTVRRSAWHALDHAWEIEDRAMKPLRRR